jgi:hypothetical protein
MLTRQSAQWVCRTCLSARIHSSQYRRTVQASGQSAESSESSPTNLPAEKDQPSIRRIPLKELLKGRKPQTVPEPLKSSPGNQNGAQTSQKAKASKPKLAEPSNKGNQEPAPETSKGRKQDTQSSSRIIKYFSKAFPLEKFTMAIPRRKTPNPLDQLDQTSSSADSNATQQSSASATSSSDTAAGNEPASKDSERVPTRRLRNLETLDIPLPSAPQTRLRLPISLNAPGSPLSQARIKAVEETQTLPQTQIHPADPINSFASFPGSAVREVVKEFEEPGNLEHRERIWSEDIEMKAVQPLEVRPIPVLEHGLDRVLFKYLHIKYLIKSWRRVPTRSAFIGIQFRPVPRTHHVD